MLEMDPSLAGRPSSAKSDRSAMTASFSASIKMSLSKSMKEAPGASGFRSRVPTVNNPNFSLSGAPGGLETIFSATDLPPAHQQLRGTAGTELGGLGLGGVGAAPTEAEAAEVDAWEAMVADCRVRCAQGKRSTSSTAFV